MPDTPQQYTTRMLANVEGQDPAKVQGATAGKLRRLVKGLSKRTLTRPPAPGKWSVAQILAHLADGEVVHAYRLRMILSQNGTEIQAFDQDLWASAAKYDRVPVEDSLAVFEVLRRSTAKLVKSLSAAERQRYGMHSERGKETVEHIERMYAGHDINHLRQIEAIVRGGRRQRANGKR